MHGFSLVWEVRKGNYREGGVWGKGGIWLMDSGEWEGCFYISSAHCSFSMKNALGIYIDYRY